MVGGLGGSRRCGKVLGAGSRGKRHHSSSCKRVLGGRGTGVVAATGPVRASSRERHQSLRLGRPPYYALAESWRQPQGQRAPTPFRGGCILAGRGSVTFAG
jgi:hypothetical protein